MALQFCVVCGQGSTRPSWNNQYGSYVACDYHTQNEIITAIAAAGGSPVTGPQDVHTDPATDESPAD